MTLVTHALLPLAIGRPWLRRRDGSILFKEMGIVAFCGILPDAASPHIYLEARYESLSHTLWAWLAFTALVLLAGHVWKARMRPRLQILCIAAYAMHLACDMISGGIPLFYPMSRTIHGGHFISYFMWYVSDVLLFLHAWLVWRVLPRLRKRTAPTSMPSPSADPHTRSRNTGTAGSGIGCFRCHELPHPPGKIAKGNSRQPPGKNPGGT